jgi:hypothetical protein
MSVSALVHARFVSQLIFRCHIDPSVLLRWRPSSRDQNLEGVDRDGCGALVELNSVGVRKLFHGPLILVDIVAETDLGVDIVTEEVDVGLGFVAFAHRRELKQGFLNGTVVVYVDSIFEHVVSEIRRWFDEIVQHR